MKVILRNVTIAVTLFVVLISYQNCGQVQNSVDFASANVNANNGGGDIIIDTPVAPIDVPPNTDVPPPDDTVVCGGLGEDDGDEVLFGIKGSIYTSNKENDPKSAVKYASQATPVTNADGELISIYLNNINVPERKFNQGFYNLNGEGLKDIKGNLLIEYFALKLQYTLRLPEDHEAGYYHIAIESDDGALLKTLQSDNSYKTLIDNDGQHSTQVKCTSKAVYLDHTSQIPSELYYYQGPREHIALRLAWKKVSAESDASGCGKLADADGSSKSNGFSVIPAAAYQQPGVVKAPNPCVGR